MKILDIGLIVTIISLFIVVVIIFSIGNKSLYTLSQSKFKNKFIKLVPALAVFSLLTVILLLNLYFKTKSSGNVESYKTIKKEIKQNSLNMSINKGDTYSLPSDMDSATADDYSTNNHNKARLENDIILLNRNINELEILLIKSKKEEYVTGRSSINLDSLNYLLFTTKEQLDLLTNLYEERFNDSIFLKKVSKD